MNDQVPSEENDDGREEFRYISEMIEAARKAGLLTEVIWSFGLEREAGHSVGAAAAFALHEWDI